MADSILAAIKLDEFQVAQGANAVLVKIKLATGQQSTFSITPLTAIELAKRLADAAAAAATATTENGFRQ